MSVLRRLAQPAEQRAANLGVTEEVLSALSARRLASAHVGGPVTWTRAMQHVAVWASVNFIADMISTLPFHAYTDRNGTPEKRNGTPLLDSPDPEVDAIGWRRQALVSALMRGNALGLVLSRDRLGWPQQVRLTHPDDWRAKRKGKLDLVRWFYDGVEIAPDDMWRMTAYQMPGSPVGVSPLTYVAQTIGLGLAANEFGSQFFGESATPTALLVNDDPIDDEIAMEAKERWDAGAQSRGVRVLGDGWQYHRIQIAPEESQFLDTIQANGAAIATFFGLRPEDIGYSSGDSMTYANIEQRNIGRLVYPLHGWIRRLEVALSSAMPRPQYVKANVDGLLRVDMKTRTDVNDKMVRMGAKSINEVRALDELPPIADGDQYLWPPYRAFPLESDQEPPADA